MTNWVVYEQRGPVAWVTMNRPDAANAQTAAMTRAMDQAFRRAVDDDEIKVGDENTLPRLSSIHFDVKGVEADTFGLSFLRPSRRRGLRL